MAREELSRALVVVMLALASLTPRVAAAQDQRPLPPGAPDAMPLARARVHVLVNDALDPDRLRRLARPNVTLWLSTRSNTLRQSTLEQLARFDEAWVQLRAPLKSIDATQLARAPRAGVWTDAASASVARLVPGARRLAVSLSFVDEGVLSSLAAAHPAIVSWAPGGQVDLLQWSLFRQLPGRHVVVAAPNLLLPVRCADRTDAEPALELHVANLLALSSDVFPCGKGTRVLVPVDVDRWLLQSLLVRDPSVELVLDVGSDDERASRARELLEALGLGPAR